ncbi:BBF_HP2_G0015140.mRNA.1.CDS.1 [Saccharomyces cerevisiae]|nr:BBF_HP2_G0015140.mRNA.1.CDS.1 [Saccharomyces cerevisiae]CAI6480777.1 BBF_HP2_G0015140.mRNA.1.CDS.1 [Saccharomyces cerevisiae]CAI6481521.1 BBF_HP1_G0015240.mRNA.1.CDS.1 [Saccharomyces cerevisiae]
MSRRVVITGLGCVTPLGRSLSESWGNLLSSKNGLTPITSLPNYNEDYKPREKSIPSTITVGKIPENFQDENPAINKLLFTSQDERRTSSFIKLALRTTYEALHNAGLLNPNDITINTSLCNLDHFGCLIGSGIGSIQDIYQTSLQFHNDNKRINPYFVPKILTNMAAGNVSIKFNLRGLSHSVSTACATGNNSIGDAFNFIRLGMQDICVAGASETSLHPLSLAGFIRAKSITTNGISRPFDTQRSGFVLGEGCGMIVMESLEHAQKRHANIISELVGYGLSSDACHITSPPADGNGAKRAIEMALKMARLEPTDVDYVNAHATSTLLGDKAECLAVASALLPGRSKSKPLYISSNKGAIGHLLGAAGAVESIFTICSLKDDKMPHTLNLDNVLTLENNEADKLHFIRDKPIVGANPKYALCNSFGFGGVNTSLLFKKWEGS